MSTARKSFFRDQIRTTGTEQHFEQLGCWQVVECSSFQELVFISTYFAVAKNTEVARAIFNGRRLSASFRPPPVVNLLDIPEMIRTLATLCHEGRLSCLLLDFRHFFHQIPLGKEVRRFFGLRIDNDFFQWKCLPMGWSFSPRIAQSISWMITLLRE